MDNVRHLHNFALVQLGYYCSVSGTVRVPMLVRIFRDFDGPELLMLAAASAFVVVSVTYLF